MRKPSRNLWLAWAAGHPLLVRWIHLTKDQPPSLVVSSIVHRAVGGWRNVRSVSGIPRRSMGPIAEGRCLQAEALAPGVGGMSEKKKTTLTLNMDDVNREWPDDLKAKFFEMCDVGYQGQRISILCTIGVNIQRVPQTVLTVFFSPSASVNTGLPEMCDDIAQFFHDIAKRSRQ